MTKKMVFFLFMLNAFNTSESLSPTNFCILPKDYLKEVRCKQFQCASEFCSTSENKCKAFIGWTALLYKNVSFIQKAINKYPDFVANIKGCASSQYVMMKSEVCHNKKVCYENKKWMSRLMFKGATVKRKKQCACKGKYKFDCENEYCGVDKKTCQVMFEDKMYPEIVINIKLCQ